MNIETGEIKNADDLTAEQRASGKWVPLPPYWRVKSYTPKAPSTRHDFTRLQHADDRRARKAARRRQRA